MSSRGWPAYAIERFRKLHGWREIAEKVAKACREVLGSSCLEVYVVGGAAEDRLTTLSDIDVVIIVDRSELKTLEGIVAIKRRAEELGAPEDIWLDIKILTEKEFSELVERGVYRRVVRIA